MGAKQLVSPDSNPERKVTAMTSALDRLLAKKAVSYIVTEEKAPKPSPAKPGKPAKAAKVSTPSINTGAVLAPSNNPDAPVITGPVLPLKGTFDARRFILAFRDARDHNQKIQAIAGFVGFEPRESYSANESRAMFQYRKESQGVTAGRDRTQRSADLTVKGYVKGMPDALQGRIDNLKARERLVVEEIAAANKRAQDETLSASERAEAEAERLVLTAHALHPLREDLKRMGALDE